VQKFGPFSWPASIRHVTADEHEVERISGMKAREPRQHTMQAIVSARAAAAAFNAKAVSLTNHVEVREMCDTPGPVPGGRVECAQIERLIHARIRKAPRERSDREVSGDQDDRVGDRRQYEPMKQRKIAD